jgi:hypothetical protein
MTFRTSHLVLSGLLAFLPSIAQTQVRFTSSTMKVSVDNGGVVGTEKKGVQVPVAFGGGGGLYVAYIDTLTTVAGETASLEETLTITLLKRGRPAGPLFQSHRSV